MKLLAKYTLICIIIYSIPFINRVIAQNYSYNWINYTTKHGLPSNRVYYCYQDKDGFMWFGTNTGVSKFDGTKFVNYEERNGLSNLEITKIQEDDFGNLWVCSLWGNIFQFKNDSFIPFKYNSLIQGYKDKFQFVSGFDIQTNKSDSVNSFYIGMQMYGVLKINSKGEKVDLTSKQQLSLILYESSRNSFATTQIAFNDLRLHKSELIKPCPILKIRDNKLDFLYEENILNGSNGFYMKHLDCHLIGTHGYLFNFGIDTSYYFSNVKNCLNLKICKNGQVLIGQNDKGGVLEFSNFQNMNIEKPRVLLKNVSVSKILIDNQQGYWVTTTENGVFYLNNKSLERLTLDGKKAINEDIEKIKLSDNGSNIWFFNKDNELINYHLGSRKLKLLKLPNQIVKDILPVPSTASIYISGSIFTFFIENNKIHGIFDNYEKVNLVSKEMVHSKFTNSVFTFNHWGLYELRRDSIVFRMNFDFKNRVSNMKYLSIYNDPFDSLWIVRKDGIFQLDYFAKSLNKKSVDFNSIEISGVRRLSSSCFLYSTTNSGIIIVDKDTTLIINREGGLQSNKILDVKLNGVDKIYVRTSTGIDQINYSSDKRIEIVKVSKVKSLDELSINDFDVDSNGIWLATSQGVYFKQNEIEVSYTPIPFLEEIVFEHERSGFEWMRTHNPLLIRWNCINFSLLGRINYRYRMGPSQKWIYTMASQLSLLNFNANEYLFEVQAQNADGLWSNSLRKLINIRKPWYESDVFYLLVALTIGSSIFYYFSLKNQRLLKEVALNLELAEMERKLFSMQMNPHFLFNCLTSIQLLIRQNDLEKASIYLSKFAALTRSVLNYVKSTIITIEDEVQFLDQYLTLEKLRFKNKLIYSINVDPKISGLDILIPSLLVQPFVENSIKYGQKNSDHILNISIEFKIVSNHILSISILDNGPGINFENPNNTLGDLGKVESIGINLSRQRINNHNRTLNINGLKIESVQNEENAITGTKVEILLMTN